MINTDLAEGQLNGNYHSQTKYNLDGTCEVDAWETERCQLASCRDCEELNITIKDTTRDTVNVNYNENSAIDKTAEKLGFYNNFENLENSLINQEMDNKGKKPQKP